eukprot:1629604-Rhodomonas_salina.1
MDHADHDTKMAYLEVTLRACLRSASRLHVCNLYYHPTKIRTGDLLHLVSSRMQNVWNAPGK